MTIVPVTDPLKRLDATLVDVSASGMLLIVSETLNVGSRAVVELESHVVLAEVQRSDSRGSHFAVGVSRVATLLRLDIAPDTSWEQMVDLLLFDAIARGSENAQIDGVESQTPPVAGLMRIPRISMPLSWCGDDRVLSPQTTPADGSPGVEVVAGPRITLSKGQPVTEPLDFPMSPLLERAGVADLQAPDFRGSGLNVECPTSKGATIPDVQVLPPPGRRNSRVGFISVATAACALTAVAVGFVWGPLQGSQNHAGPGERVRAKVSMSPRASQVAYARTEAPIDAAPAFVPSALPAPSIEPAMQAVNSSSSNTILAVMQSSAINWVSVCSDTKDTYQRLLQAGDKLEFPFAEKAVIRMGNSGAAEITVDGKPLGSAGPPGSIRVILLKPAGFQYLGGLPADGSADCSAL